MLKKQNLKNGTSGIEPVSYGAASHHVTIRPSSNSALRDVPIV